MSNPVFNNRRKSRVVMRFAACAALGIATVLTGTLGLPAMLTGHQSKGIAAGKATHELFLSVAADNTSNVGNIKGKKILMTPGVSVNIPNYKMIYNSTTGGYDVGAKSLFSCTGDNLRSVTYTAENGSMDYFCDELQVAYDKVFRKYIVCQLLIPKKSLYYSYCTKEENENNYSGHFIEMWNEGKFEDYRKKYSLDENAYNYDFEITEKTRIGYTFINDNPADGHLLVDSDLCVVTFLNRSIDKIQLPPMFYCDEKSVTTHVGEHNQWISWNPPVEFLIKSQSVKNQISSSIPKDTITIKATFNDGQTVTKHVNISLDSSGKIQAVLTD